MFRLRNLLTVMIIGLFLFSFHLHSYAADVHIEENRSESQKASADSLMADLVMTPSNTVPGTSVELCPMTSGPYHVSLTASNNAVIIGGYIDSAYPDYAFGSLFIDGTRLKSFSGQTSISKQSISLSSISGIETGYHTAFLQIYDKKDTSQPVALLYKTQVTYNDIKDKPTYKGKFDVYSKYFYFYPYNMALSNQQGQLYMEYSANGGKTWKRTGYMTANAIKLYTEQSYKISGLKADKKYRIRIRYGKYVTYNNPINNTSKSYFFGGPALNCGTIKTGKAKAPKIKSVNVKAVNVRYHKIRHYGKYTGVYLYTEKFYTCRFKVTVQLKSKPGTKGLWLNGRYLKGNKKKYTTVFSPYPNYYFKKPPRGLSKYKVSIASYKAKKYGGFSPLKNKKVKIR